MYSNKFSRPNMDYIIAMQQENKNNKWTNQLWNKFTDFNRKNGQHRLLQQTDSPTISASTTVTNFESFETLSIPIVSNNRRMGTLEENLRVAQPEIEPLQNTEKQERLSGSKTSINSSHTVTVYNSTTIAKPQLFHQALTYGASWRERETVSMGIITSLSVSLVSMVVGFVSAYTSPAAESLRTELGISEIEISWVGGLMPLGALVGGLVGGQMIELLGRKFSIIVTDVLFIISWICIAAASNIWFLYVGRAIAGVSVGIASLALPVYLGETIQPEVRGTLGLLPTGLGNIGILVCFVVGTYLPWDQLAWLGVALPMPFLLLTFLIPETPRWYVSKGKYERAKDSLQWLRGKDADVQEEFDSLAKSQKENDEDSYNFWELLKSNNLKPLLISLGLMFFQQMSGINAVIFYTTTIFDMAGSTIDKNLATIIVGIVNFVSTFIATVLIDRLGRKILLYISSVSMVITLGTLGTYFYLLHIEVSVSEYGWLPLASFVIYVLGFSLGFGPIPWLMMGEIFPAKIRGSAASVATAFNWTCTFVVTKTFVDIIGAIGPYGTFWMFAIICLISLGFVIIWVPETQGQSLQDIERKLAGLKVRRMSSVANLKPLPSTF